MAGAVRTRRATGVSRQLVTAMAVTALVLFAGLAVWLMVRRLSGALSQPLSGPEMVLSAIVIAFTALGLQREATRTQYLVHNTPYIHASIISIAAVVMLASITLPGTPALAIAIAWVVLVSAEAASWLAFANARFIRFRQFGLRRANHSEPAVADEEPQIPAGLVQKLTRVCEGDRESIHVLANADILEGDRRAVVHVSFCPPLASRPELTAHAMDADDVEVRLTQAESFGARVEIRAKQDQPGPRSILIEVLGSVTYPKSA